MGLELTLESMFEEEAAECLGTVVAFCSVLVALQCDGFIGLPNSQNWYKRQFCQDKNDNLKWRVLNVFRLQKSNHKFWNALHYVPCFESDVLAGWTRF